MTKSYLVNLNPNLLDLGSISWNSVESVSFQIFLLGLELLHRLPHEWWDLDDLPCGRATLGGQFMWNLLKSHDPTSSSCCWWRGQPKTEAVFKIPAKPITINDHESDTGPPLLHKDYLQVIDHWES